MAKWVWSCRVLKILPLIASSSGDVFEAGCYCYWRLVHQCIPAHPVTPINDLYIKGRQKILSPDQITCTIFNLSVSPFLIKALVREKPA
jgi:hypothetical protein